MTNFKRVFVQEDGGFYAVVFQGTPFESTYKPLTFERETDEKESDGFGIMFHNKEQLADFKKQLESTIKTINDIIS